MKPNLLLLIFTLLFLCYKSNAQAVLNRSVVGSTGGSIQTGNTLIQYTLGEVAILTQQSNDLMLTQGFQQPESAIPTTETLVIKDMIVYPNPATTRTKVEFDLLANAKVMINLVDNAGRMVYSYSLSAIAGKIEHIISLNGLAPGVYHVVMYVNYKVYSEKLVIH
ncbi:Por secretion system C-terminal sorting domain-containing protein [Pedobacter sp. ok626]|uniref:T9SS type A sorting domain-containing protein n=1 Tax=Pedobacter sp. ok626 TaxID=1761882 RepID=UPI00087E9A5D|nr:T9SS type A sorting domain-containing protein [Pedobacter sp. ok626]SDL75835.1 Por secretion system C-terminal sorting domain-containing protein [Pedobacter sp. ok626]